MYSKSDKILSSSEFDLKSYIESTDIYNSKLYYILPKLPVNGTYRIDLNEYRIDLISTDIYDTPLLSEILLIYNGITIDQLKSGTDIRVPHIEDIRHLFRNINTITNAVEYIKTISGE